MCTAFKVTLPRKIDVQLSGPRHGGAAKRVKRVWTHDTHGRATGSEEQPNSFPPKYLLANRNIENSISGKVLQTTSRRLGSYSRVSQVVDPRSTHHLSPGAAPPPSKNSTGPSSIISPIKSSKSQQFPPEKEHLTASSQRRQPPHQQQRPPCRTWPRRWRALSACRSERASSPRTRPCPSPSWCRCGPTRAS